MNGEFINLDTAKKIQEIDKMEENLKKIIQKYGTRNQLKKLSEELYEFQESVIEHEFVDILQTKAHLIEEYADLCVLLSQFELYFDLDEDEVWQVMKNKVDRQLKRIENDNHKN